MVLFVLLFFFVCVCLVLGSFPLSTIKMIILYFNIHICLKTQLFLLVLCVFGSSICVQSSSFSNIFWVLK